jgi:hypothetical protein
MINKPSNNKQKNPPACKNAQTKNNAGENMEKGATI